MKKSYSISIFVLLHFLLLSQCLNAQQGKIQYKFSEPENNNTYTPTLVFNDTLSLFSYKRIGIDSPMDPEKIEKKENGGYHLTINSGDKEGQQIYTNFRSKEIIVRKPESIFSNAYVTEDTWIEIDWKITSETKKIGEYDTIKAIGKFRGRTYIVWFTNDIPFPIGPWKLKGLPGAILEAEDKEKMFEITLVSVEFPHFLRNQILKPDASKVISFQDHVSILDRYDEILLKKMRMRLPPDQRKNLSLIKKSKKEKRKMKKEKIYEWETK